MVTAFLTIWAAINRKAKEVDSSKQRDIIQSAPLRLFYSLFPQPPLPHQTYEGTVMLHMKDRPRHQPPYCRLQSVLVCAGLHRSILRNLHPAGCHTVPSCSYLCKSLERTRPQRRWWELQEETLRMQKSKKQKSSKHTPGATAPEAAG